MRQTELAIPFGGASLFAREWLPELPPRAVVCLVHGLGEHSGRYRHVAERLSAADLAVLAIDLPGHGRSPGPRGHATYPQLLDAVDALLAESAARLPETPRFLYGHSLGGGVVLCHALRRRPALAGVIATSPLLLPAVSPPAWKTGLARVAARVWPTLTLANGLESGALARESAVAAEYRGDPLVHDRVSAALGDGMLAAGRWSLAHAAEFPLPLLLVHGTVDRITDHEASRRFAAAAGGCTCTLRLWEGLYHETHNEAQWAEVLGDSISWMVARLP